MRCRHDGLYSKGAPLWKLVCEGAEILDEELKDMIASYQVHGGGLESFADREAYRYARRLDRWLKKARAELLKVPKS